MENKLPARIRIATRESALALAQSRMVAATLTARHPGLEVELVGMTTRGDRILDRPLSQVGGKGLFVKELELALDEDRADLAVHSMKDVPMQLAPRFVLATFGERESPLDAFVSTRHAGLESLPDGAVVGTSSLRRECQLRHAFPQLAFRALRGNVNTRLAKLDAGEYAAIILAVAGLRRLGFDSRIRAMVPRGLAVPAIAQGILAVEHLATRADVAALVRGLEHRPTALAASAERALGLVVEGSCEVPVGALAIVEGEELELEAFVGLPDGSKMVRQTARGPASRAEELGRELGERLLAAGAGDILRELKGRAA